MEQMGNAIFAEQSIQHSPDDSFCQKLAVRLGVNIPNDPLGP
ncbi:hypothetical protein [Erythrobacter litoralis]|nr:hypothetical protein [Erythrobacter litoralis]